MSDPTPGTSRRSGEIADAAMLATVVIWAGNNVMIKGAIDTIAPLPFVFFRFLFVVVIVFAWYAIRRSIPTPPRADWGWFLLTGLTGYAIYNALYMVGLQYTTAFSAAVMISLGPLFTMALAAALKIEQTRTIQWVGLGISSIGVVIYVSDKLKDGLPAKGDLICLVAAFSFAVYSLATRPIVQRHGSLMVTAWSCLIGLAVITPFALSGLRSQEWGSLGAHGWGAILYSSAISMLLGYTIWGWAIERTGVGRTAPFLYLVPILTGVMSYLFLDETFNVVKLLGAAFVFAGVIVARSGAKNATIAKQELIETAAIRAEL
jgi:drug/metabolite transporter (DMT)-like permease